MVLKVLNLSSRISKLIDSSSSFEETLFSLKWMSNFQITLMKIVVIAFTLFGKFGLLQFGQKFLCFLLDEHNAKNWLEILGKYWVHLSHVLACCRDTIWEPICDGNTKNWSWNGYTFGEYGVSSGKFALSSYSLGQWCWSEFMLLILCWTQRQS